MTDKENEVLQEAIKAICDNDIYGYKTTAWNIVKIIGGDDLVKKLDRNKFDVYREYVLES